MSQSMSTLTIGGVPQVGAVPWELPPNQDAQTCASGPREILSWEIGQKYFFDPTFGNALAGRAAECVYDDCGFHRHRVSQFESRHFAPIISRLRIETSPRTNTEWDLDYDVKAGRINSSLALVNYHYGPFTIGGGDAFLRVIDAAAGTVPTLATANEFHQFRVLFGYGQLNKRGLSAASSFGFDANLGSLQYASAQTSYTWDCCGLSLEYRRFALGTVRNENQYRFSFTLANVGSIRQPQTARAALLSSTELRDESEPTHSESWIMEMVNTAATLDQKAERLRQILADRGRLIVAYSGGVDSAFLAWMAHQVLGGRMCAVIADSASLARTHLEDALAFAREREIPVEVVETRELENPAYVRNDAMRCFHCKDELFTVLESYRESSADSMPSLMESTPTMRAIFAPDSRPRASIMFWPRCSKPD